MLVRPRAPEVVEADLVERLRRLVARDVPAELGRLGVRLEDDRDRVPADERRREALELGIARQLRLVLDGIVLTYGVETPAPTETPRSCA